MRDALYFGLGCAVGAFVGDAMMWAWLGWPLSGRLIINVGLASGFGYFMGARKRG